jgi:hypothetical protein
LLLPKTNYMRSLLFTAFWAMLMVSLQAQPFDFETEASGSTGTLVNGWVGAPTTNFRWLADVGGTGSPGTGPAVDHTLGTAAGVYMYTEASAPAVTGDVATLTSPTLSLTGLTFPALEFWYHKFGADMGDLFVEINDNGTWVVLDSIIGSTQGSEVAPWLKKSVFMGGYGNSVEVRFRAVCGAGFTGDMAVDDVNVIDLPAFDGGLIDVYTTSEYLQYPLQQAPSGIFAGGTVANLGGDTLTNVRLVVSAGTFLDSATQAILLPGAVATLQLTNPISLPLAAGSVTPFYTLVSDQTDASPGDNLATGAAITVSDSIYARDDSSFTGSLGIGPGTEGVLGQNFEIFQTDTLTSVSFFLNAPPIGQDIWVDIYTFNDSPQSIIATTDTLNIPVDTPAWYTLQICPVELQPGTYFLGVNEGDANIALGTTTEYFTPNAGWVIFGANPWQPSEFYGFELSYLLRANLATPTILDLDLGPDTTICALDQITLDPGPGFLNPLWFGLVDTPTITISPNNSAFLIARGINGCIYTDTINVSAFPISSPGVDDSLELCVNAGQIGLLDFLGGTPDAGGTWVDNDNSTGLLGGDFDPVLSGAGTYSLTYTVNDTCGYDSSATLTISVLPAPAGADADSSILDVDPTLDLNTLLSSNATLGGTWSDPSSSGGLTNNLFVPAGVAAGVYPLLYIVENEDCGRDTATITITVELKVNIKGLNGLSFGLYPNPNQGEFSLSFAQTTAANKTVVVLDQLGRQVHEEVITGAADTHRINLTSLPQGIYLLRVSAGQQSGQRQVIIK